MGVKEASQGLCHTAQEQRERNFDSGEVSGDRSEELLPPVSKIFFKSLLIVKFCAHFAL